MWQQLSQAGADITRALTTALGVVYNQATTVISHLYLVLVRQEILIGIQMVIMGIMWLLLSGIVIKIISSVWKQKDWEQLDKLVLSVALCFVLYVSITSGVTNLISSVPRIANPEYYAIQDSVNLLQQLRTTNLK